jgi:hypothetical protein
MHLKGWSYGAPPHWAAQSLWHHALPEAGLSAARKTELLA